MVNREPNQETLFLVGSWLRPEDFGFGHPLPLGVRDFRHSDWSLNRPWCQCNKTVGPVFCTARNTLAYLMVLRGDVGHPVVTAVGCVLNLG
jgi:hypothetical protein